MEGFLQEKKVVLCRVLDMENTYDGDWKFKIECRWMSERDVYREDTSKAK